ncbi:MAG: SRPBCC domain-containing protein [Bacteroidota bacterium]
MKTGSIKQTITFDASAADVYDLIMNSKKHQAFSKSTVTMSKSINRKFSVFGGYCLGYNIELIAGKKIAQAWHFMEDGWPDDHFSICTFRFEPFGKKTRLTFTQTGIPYHKVGSLKMDGSNSIGTQ